MRSKYKGLVLITLIVAASLMLLMGGLIIYEDLIDPGSIESLLYTLRIPLNSNVYYVIYFIVSFTFILMIIISEIVSRSMCKPL